MHIQKFFRLAVSVFTIGLVMTYSSFITLVEAGSNIIETFNVIVLLEYSQHLDEVLYENPESVYPLRITVADQIRIIDVGEAIENTLGNPVQIEFVLDNNQIPEGEFFDVCVKYEDESYEECKTVANSPLNKPEIIPFNIG